MSENNHPCQLIRTDETAQYFLVPDSAFEMSIRRHKDEEHMLISIFAVEDFLGSNELNILYVFENRNSPLFEILIISRVRGDLIGPPSIARVFPSANLFEREIADSFGIAFPGAYDTRRLYLHESYPHNFYPLRKAVPNQFPGEGEQAEWYQFKEIQGEGVFVVPVGPVHAGIIEPGHFRFSVIGETIVNLEIRLGFLHRGVEKLAEGRIPSEGVSIVESISGDESVVNACGFCCAVEQICGVSVPPRALYIRGILLELERAYSLISDLAGMVTDIAHPASASQLLMLRETLQRQADILTGSRFMKGSICIGGVKQDISPSLMDDLFKAAGHIERELQRICNWILGISTVIDRFASTGQIRVDLINSLSLSGPIARACGSNADVRMDHPYGIYRERPSPLNFVIGGDVLARFTLKYQEVLGALRYIQELIVFLPEGPVTCPVPISDGYALATLESPRGMTMHWVLIQQGKIARYKVRTASLCNWYAIEHAVIGNIVPDFPLINKSLNLSYAGTDL